MKYILIGERYRPFLKKSLEIQGFEPIWMPDNPLFDPRLAGHTDLSAIKLGNKMVVSSHIIRNDELVKKITNRGIEVICCKREQSCAYPKDINLCSCISGDYLIHNTDHTDEAIIDSCRHKIINVKQGYANCMILALGKRIITADNGIASICAINEIDVLKISSGGIMLEGFEEGFIGGASFVYEGTVFFTGDIFMHPDGERIVDYIGDAGYEICCLNDGNLIDIGSAVLLD